MPNEELKKLEHLVAFLEAQAVCDELYAAGEEDDISAAYKERAVKYQECAKAIHTIAALQQDAERYRWVRDHHLVKPDYWISTAEAFDKAIDAEMRGQDKSQ